jgi:hypothetical protein
MLSQRRGMNAYSDHKVTRGYVYFGNQRVGVVERREALAAAQSATPGGIERAPALSNNNNRPTVFPNGKDRWTSYIRDHQGRLLVSLSEYEAPATSWGMSDPRYRGIVFDCIFFCVNYYAALFIYFWLFIKTQKDLVVARFSFLLIVLLSIGLLSGCSGIQDMLKGDQWETGGTGNQGVTGNVGAQGPIGETGGTGNVGAQGPEGPALSGRWVGHMYLLELDGRLAADHSGITVTLMAPVSLTSAGPSLPSSVQTDVRGQFVFPGMVTGLYSLRFSKEGYGTTYYYNMLFTGGGDQRWRAYGDIPVDTALLKAPDFQIESIATTNEFNSAGTFYVKVATNGAGKKRNVILFWSTSESVSSQNYIGYRTEQVGNYANNYNGYGPGDSVFQVDRNASYDSFPAGTLYFKAYPMSYSVYSQEGLSIQWPGIYADRVTGRLTYTSLGAPSETLRVEDLRIL